MQNIKENKRVYLSGGGNEKQSFPLDKFFFHTLPKNGRFLYIPIALRGHKLYSTTILWMKNITELHQRRDVWFETVDDPSRCGPETLKEFNGIYIGGGNTWSLIQELKYSGFADILIQYLKTGGQVYGGSAGAIIMGNRIDTQDDENKFGLEDISGFNLIDNFSVACHFKDEQSDRFKTWAINKKLPIICLSEETGLIIENGVALCAGTKSVVIYFADGTKTEIRPEESFTL